MRFVKMHGLGNDFIVVNGFTESLPAELSLLAKNICHRQLGVGGDGLLVVGPTEAAGADACFDIYNSDGSRAEMCGNGIRCATIFAQKEGICKQEMISFATLAGLVKAQIVDGQNNLVKVKMGTPYLNPREIPANFAGEMMVSAPVIVGHHTYNMTLVSMGNPHSVIFVEDVENYPVQEEGPKIEKHDLFPAKTNVEFIQPVTEKKLRMRVWERGCGETLACGTGACAAVVAAVLNNICQKDTDIEVVLRHGSLIINWGRDNQVTMTGPAVYVFSGQYDV
ncbi:MAG: diaminopimelate epimerase [Bacillota bacterium]|jgi:diaminopimelate epimerase